jgi:hypothetical protein
MLLLLGSLMLAQPEANASGGGQPIVITAQAINQSQARLRDCIARSCPPNEEIDASLALAELQLLDGKYHQARTTLLKALGRNKREAAAYPVPVSDLYRANGRVAAHLGLDADYYRSTWGIYRTLKYGLPPDDVRQYSALMEVAEMMYRTYGHERARLYYEAVARRARKAGRPDIAAIAELRSAIRHLPPDSSWQVNAIKKIASFTEPNMRAPALEAKLALARMAYAKGDERGAQAVEQELASMKLKIPVLIYSPPYETAARDATSVGDLFGQRRDPVTTITITPEEGRGTIMRAGTALAQGPQTFATTRAAPVVDDMWLDVAFRITPDGRVADLEVTRSHGDVSWAGPLLGSIRGRRYTPAVLNSPGSHRLERYTYTSGFETKTQTRVAGRSPETRIEYLDLSGAGLTTSD